MKSVKNFAKIKIQRSYFFQNKFKFDYEKKFVEKPDIFSGITVDLFEYKGSLDQFKLDFKGFTL